jgi:hypothetical protein
LWTLLVTNKGPGIAYDSQLFGLMLTQTLGKTCTTMPVRLSPAAFPILLGTLSVTGSAQTSVTLDFSGCPSGARFTVGIGYMSNGGSSVGLIQMLFQSE